MSTCAPNAEPRAFCERSTWHPKGKQKSGWGSYPKRAAGECCSSGQSDHVQKPPRLHGDAPRQEVRHGAYPSSLLGILARAPVTAIDAILADSQSFDLGMVSSSSRIHQGRGRHFGRSAEVLPVRFKSCDFVCGVRWWHSGDSCSARLEILKVGTLVDRGRGSRLKTCHHTGSERRTCEMAKTLHRTFQRATCLRCVSCL